MACSYRGVFGNRGIGGINMSRLDDIKAELHKAADMQFDSIKECFVQMKNLLGDYMSEDEILDKLLETMQSVTGITYDTIKKQLADTKARIDAMAVETVGGTDV